MLDKTDDISVAADRWLAQFEDALAKPEGEASAAWAFSAAKMASRPLTVCSVQLSASTSRQ